MGENQQKTSFIIIGSIITFLLQVIIAPNIAILGVVPNFFLVFVVFNSMRTTRTQACLTGFFLGLLYDFISQSALGVMSFVLSVISFSVSSFNKDLFSESWISQAFFLLLAAFFGELLNSVFLSILGIDRDFLTSLGMRVLPGSIYDALFGLIIFPIMARQKFDRKKNQGALKGRFD